MYEVDLTKNIGCNDNPISLLLNLINEGKFNEFIVITKKNIIPFQFAKLLASRKGYDVILIEESEDLLKLKFFRVS